MVNYEMINYDDPIIVEQEELDKVESVLRDAKAIIEHVEFIRWGHDWWKCAWCSSGHNDYGQERMIEQGEKFEHTEYCQRQEILKRIAEVLPQ